MGLDQYHRERPRGDRFHRDAPVEGCVHCREEAANSLHIHGRPGECPVPGCQEASAPELPTVLYRIEVARYSAEDAFADPTRRVYYQENEQAAVEEIEDALDGGAGLRSVHKLALVKVDGQPRWYWDRLDYRPPGPGRFVAPKSP